MEILIREYKNSDAEALNRIAVAAFSEFAEYYSDWPALRERIAVTSRLTDEIQFFVAEELGVVLGLIGYNPPFGPRSDFLTKIQLFYACSWSIRRIVERGLDRCSPTIASGRQRKMGLKKFNCIRVKQ